MRKLIVCNNLKDIEKADSNSVLIISHTNLKSLFTQRRIKRLKAILDELQVNIPIGDIEIHEITKGLRKINKKIKILNEKVVSLDLIKSLQNANIIPVIIV